MEKGDKTSKTKEEASSSSGGHGGGVKRKKVYNVEPRTPLKRQRIPVVKFQSPVLEEGTPKVKPPKEETIILYKKGIFLAVRGAENSIYLCKTQQNVHSHSRQFRIQWLNVDQPPNIYKMDYVDHTDIECVLTNVRMERIARDTLRLPHSEQERAEKILEKAVKVERGEPIEEEEVEPIVEEVVEEDVVEEEEEEWQEEPTPKKAKSTKGKAKAVKKSKGMKVSLSKGKKSKQTKKEKEKKGKGKEKKKKEEKKKGPDRKLKPNPKIKILEKSLFFESKEKMPFISTAVKTRQVIRAAMMNDMDLLKSLISSEKDVYRLDVTRSVENHVTAVDYAIEKGNKEMIKLLIEDIFKSNNKRCEQGPPSCLLQTADTGHYNPAFLGIRNVRALNVSRGSREGNNAFTKDLHEDSMNMDYVLESMLKKDADPDMLEVVMAANPSPHETREDMLQTLFENIHTAVLLGNRKLAGKLVADAEKAGGHGFNFLHTEVLNFEKEDLRASILPASVRKKPFGNGGVTPLHCAAINPSVKYLSRLLQIEPDINLMDKSHRRPIHYSAACQGSGPLELLLERGASMSEVDSQGNTAIHFACRAGRAHNADIVLKKAKMTASAMGDVGSPKWGVGGINRPNRFSICPIHDAIFSGHFEVVKILIKHGADLNKQLSAGKEKKSPLMLAAERGNLDIARLLVQNGATVELLDKLKRSALTHAILNGNSNVASYLLYLGADPNRADSSGNTLVHYAAAYGWYFCLKMLINDAGADANKPNGWNSTPVAIAFLKGHMGIVGYLLNQPGVDINFKDDNGLTLVSTAVGSRVTKSLLGQVEYLVKEKKADPTVTDNEGKNALHHLAANNIKLSGGHLKDVCETAMDTSVKIAECLIAAGCDPAVRTVDGQTPVMLAIERVNSRLVRYLVENGGTVSPEMNKDRQNVLHLMAGQCMTTDLAPLIEILADHKLISAKKSVKKVASVKTTAEESMDVDEVPAKDGNAELNDGKTAEVNGEKEGVKESSEKVEPTDLSQKVNGEIGEEPMSEVVEEQNVLKMMAIAVDKNGMTPLLKACLVYKNHEKARFMNEAQYEKVCQQGRDFIRAVIDLAGSDINKAVEKKYFEGTPPNYTSEFSYYVKEAKYTALHMMVEAKQEQSVERDGVKITSPGLQLILKFKPKLELRSLADKTALSLAVDLNKEDMVKMLLESGADPNTSYGTSTEGPLSPLMCAARDRQEKLLKLLVEAKASVNVSHKNSHKTPLHFIVQSRGNEASTLSMVQALVGAGADVNAVDNHKRTVLHLAVNSNSGTSNASTDLEEYLIEKGANIFCKDIRDRLPLHYTFVKFGKYSDGSSLDPIELCSLLTSVMGGKNVDDADAFGQTALHCASVRGATICCMHLLQRKAEIGKKDHNGNTPLSLAVNNRHDSCAIMLIQRGASVRDHIVIPQTTKEDKPKPENDKKKKRPVLSWRPLTQWDEKTVKADKITYPIFQGAISSELQGVAHIILDTAGMDFSAVEAALSVWKYNVVLRLMKRIPDASRLHTINEDGRNLFHILVLKARGSSELEAQLKVARALRDKGVSVGLRDKYGCTPLHYAALHHHPRQLGQFLLDNDPALDVKSKDKLGRDVMAAYMWDLNNVDTDWLKMLLEKGATFDVRYDRPLPDPLLLGTSIPKKCPDYFTMKGDVLISPLILAIHYFKFGLVSFMLNDGASPNFEDSVRRTPLMHAARRNDVAISKVLLNFTYDPSSQPKEAEPTKLKLAKSLSRTVFMLRPDGSMSAASEIIEEEEEENASGNEEEGNEEVEDDVASEDKEEEPVDDAGDDDQAEEEEVDEEEEPVDDEPEEEDSDHDTDVVEDEEEEDKLRKQTSVLSKQLSLRTQSSSLARKDEFATVEKTSSVDLDAIDNQGWTVVHHLVSPLELGTFDQEELLFVLAKAGASLDKKDNAGLSPLDYALIRGAPKVASRLQKLLKSEKEEKPTFTSFEVNDRILSDGIKVDFKSDYDKMLDKLNEESMDVNSDEAKFTVQPDKYCNVKSSGEVVQDSKQNIPYDILLNKVDVTCGPWGMYNFYKMQIVYQKSKDLYVLFTRWGRIGDSGQYQHTPFQKKEEAIKEYCKIFRSKTGNDWSNVHSYVNHPKKYRLWAKEQKYSKTHQVYVNLTTDIPSKLSPTIQDLVKEMSSDMMLEASIKKVGMNTDYMPFGHIKKEALLEARSILTQIGELIETTEKQRNNMSSTDKDLYQTNCEKIAKLSNDYFHHVPSHGFESEAIRPISEKKMLKHNIRFLSDMLDIEIASRILLGSQMHLKEMNPLDYIYRAIGCQIEPLPLESLETQYILTYINASIQSSEVHSIYKLSRPGEEEHLRSLNMENQRLLWHGSSMSNFISILHRGLLVAPPEAPLTGHLFGEGIYFADSFAKSHGYSYNCNPTSDAKLMLLCQVALGKSKEDIHIDDDDHLDPDINSLKIVGRQQPSPDYDISMPFGTSMPLGRSTTVERKPAPRMHHNEFIVYDSSQVCIRYLVMFSK